MIPRRPSTGYAHVRAQVDSSWHRPDFLRGKCPHLKLALAKIYDAAPRFQQNPQVLDTERFQILRTEEEVRLYCVWCRRSTSLLPQGEHHHPIQDPAAEDPIRQLQSDGIRQDLSALELQEASCDPSTVGVWIAKYLREFKRYPDLVLPPGEQRWMAQLFELLFVQNPEQAQAALLQLQALPDFALHYAPFLERRAAKPA